MGLLKIPPFQDAHMHFMRDGKGAAADELPEIMSAYAAHGIFSICDMGHKSGIGLQARETSRGALLIKSAGSAFYRKGTYGAFLGKGISGEEEIREAVRCIAGAGADFIKVINSGIVSTQGECPVTEGGFSLEELGTFSREAREKNMDFICHANADVAIRGAVEAGASSIEHGYFISRNTLRRMAELGTRWTPTLSALLRVSAKASFPERQYIKGLVEKHLLSVKYAFSIGVRVSVGTDSGSTGIRHGESFIDELQVLYSAGLPLDAILAAACMDRSEIDKGNFLIVEEDFILSGKIEAVFKDGVQIGQQ